MKFNKTILAVAIAGIAAAPVAQADVTLSGYIGIIIGGSDADDIAASAAVVDNPATPEDETAEAVAASQPGELAMASDDSSLNVAASHELNSGLTGYGNWRADLGLANDGVAQADNIHLGIKGGFGDIRIGEVPDALEYGQVANDAKFDIGGEERGVSYTGSFGPATIGLNWSPVGTENGAKTGGGSDKIAAGIKFAAGGFNIGVGFGDVNENAALSAGASFGLAGFSVAVAHKSLESDAPNSDRSTLSATLGFGAGDITGKLTYEVETGDVDEDDALIRLDLAYGLGGGMALSTRITSKTDDDTAANDVTEYRVMLQKDF